MNDRTPAQAPTTGTLKDGRPFVIRPVLPADYPSLMETLRAVARADSGVVRTPAELPQTPEQERAEFEKWTTDTARHGARGCWFAAIHDGRAIGEASVRRMAPLRLRHVAHLGLSVHPEFQGLGAGRALMRAAIDWCAAQATSPFGPVSRIDLNVLANNDRAVALYSSLGFEIEGRRRRFIRREDGAEVDDFVMALFLDT